MQFVDEAVIEVVAGNGGNGAAHFRRESKVPRGGPDGGDGGRGGDVIVEAQTSIATLLDHRYRRHYRAEAGRKGGKQCASGRSGEDLIVPLPVGTVVTDEVTGAVLVDLVAPDQPVVVARGGRGGRGNVHFKTSTRRAPTHAQDGEAGEQRLLKLTLKLVADVGIIGLPNAGKSTLIRRVSKSQAKVADYPFTTLVPNLGVVRVDDRTFVMADVPGLVEGAHRGRGLGDRFLRHIERTRALVHLLSLSPDALDPVEAYDVLTRELAAHDEELSQRPRLVVFNKVDLVGDRTELEAWQEAFAARGVEPMAVSALTGEGVTELLRAIVGLLDEVSAPDEAAAAPWSPI